MIYLIFKLAAFTNNDIYIFFASNILSRTYEAFNKSFGQ